MPRRLTDISGFRALVALLSIGPAAHSAPDLDVFLGEPDFREAVISPDGHYLAQVFNRPEDHLRLVAVSDLSKPDRPVIGTLADTIRRPSSVSWANNERLLVTVNVPSDTEKVIRASKKRTDFDIRNYPMYRRTVAMDVDAKNAVVLLDDDSSIRRNVSLSTISHYLPDNPSHVMMIAYRSNRPVLYKVNVYTGDGEMVTRGSRRTFGFLSDELGNPLYRFDYLYHKKQVLVFRLNNENYWRKIEKIRLDDIEDNLELGGGDILGVAGENLVYRKLNTETGFKELVLYNLKDDSHETFASEPGRDILYPLSDDRSDEIVGYAIDGDVIRYRLFDEQAQRHFDHVAEVIGDYFFNFSSITEDGSKAIVTVQGPDDPTSYHLYNSNTKQLEFLGHAYQGIQVSRLAVPAKVTYKARDGQTIRAYALLPPGFESGKRYPLVLMPHGGPQARDRSTYDNFAQFLSTRGYIVVKPNFRGSTGYGQGFESAGYRQWGQLMQDDVTDAAEYLVREGFVDRKRICIVGISYGGYAALMGAIRTPDLIRCSVSINGVTHLRKQISEAAKRIDDDQLVEEYLYHRIGHPKADRAMLDQNSPALQADRFGAPVLIIAGTEDQRVLYWQAKKLVAALKRFDKEHRFVSLQGTGHDPFYYYEDENTVYSEVDRFLAQHLGAGKN